MALTIAPFASAQGFGGQRGRGHFGLSQTDLDAETRAEIRTELRACKDENEDNRDAIKACADAVLSTHGIERPEKPNREDIPEEARNALRDCKENNEGDMEATKECAEDIAAQYDIELPKHRGRKIGQQFKSNITETCGEREDTEQWRQCARDARGTIREDWQENRPQALERFQNRRQRRVRGLIDSANLRDELRACLQLEDATELRECVFGVRQQARENAGN